MSSQSEIYDPIARVVGGTVSAGDAHYFNGGPIASLKGCYSVGPNGVESTPVGIVLPGRFTAQLNMSTIEPNEDHVRLLVLVARHDTKHQMYAQFNNFRDTVPAAFRAHMQMFGAANVLDAFVTDGAPGVHEWSKLPYLAWEFTVRVRRETPASYVA